MYSDTSVPSLAQTLLMLQTRGLERLDAQLLLLQVLGKTSAQRSWLLAHDTDVLPPQCAPVLESLVLRRLAGEPLAYLSGHKAFYGMDVQLSADVLVPRPETETLVDWALTLLALRVGAANPQPAVPAAVPSTPQNPLHLLDLGTGSGAIALALKANQPDGQVWATDISPAALAVAQANATRLKLEVRFSHGDWLAALPLDAPRFDCIVANPPYIAEHDPHLAALGFEPVQALTSGHDGLDALRHIIAGAPAHLAPSGWLLLEHGFDQAAAVRLLLCGRGLTQVQSRRDLTGIERCSGGQWLA